MQMKNEYNWLAGAIWFHISRGRSARKSPLGAPKELGKLGKGARWPAPEQTQTRTGQSSNLIRPVIASTYGSKFLFVMMMMIVIV